MIRKLNVWNKVIIHLLFSSKWFWVDSSVTAAKSLTILELVSMTLTSFSNPRKIDISSQKWHRFEFE